MTAISPSLEAASDAPSSLPPLAGRRSLFEPPGGLLMWIIVAVELFAFGVLFVFIGLLRGAEPEAFRSGQTLLDDRIGLALTFALLTSGWLVAEAVHACRQADWRGARLRYGLALAVGVAFVALKTWDYVAKTNAGVALGVSSFWDAYLLATGFHFIHVLLGLYMLVRVSRKVGRSSFEDPETSVAGTALFWHMCDVAWFFLFPLFHIAV